MQNKIKPYVISCAIALAVGGLSALLTAGSMDLYSEIVQPPLAPPSFLFPVVWTVLYILMGIGAAMIYLEKDRMPREVSHALIVYAVNLFLNFFWSIIFFNMRAFLFSFIWLVLLWATIIVMIIKFRRIKPLAGYLQIPYLVWVTFAGYLNLAIYILNK
ncbi:MAG: tryptophan-rich sensory protein [Clostridia bacterium]|nr:tryptophan-rich sensory protein [Clostridia bacterium]MBQ7121723.1 tryptophan-rich sensory protein [Clostridia bacterium]